MTRAAVLSAVMALLAAPPASAADALRVVTTARAVQPGEVVLFTVSTTAPVEQLRARAFDRDLPTFRRDLETWQAVLGIDLDTPARPYAVSFDAMLDGVVVTTTTTLVVGLKQFPTRRLQVEAAFVNPPASTLQRITNEATDLAELWKHSSGSRLWSDAFVRPVSSAANSSFGVRSIFNGEPRQPHGGADFPSPTGTPIQAPSGGRIVMARDLYFTGNTVVIDHGLSVFSLLAHLSAMDVTTGDIVTMGQVIGQVGQTGRVTGPHLHWAVRIGDARVDPLSLLAMLGAAPALP